MANNSIKLLPLCIFLSHALPALASTNARDEVVVSATRVEQSSFLLPMSIDSISQESISNNQLHVNLSESLPQVPGVIAHNRQNYAQDLQISIRGFGARSTFGVRGVRLYVDGIPATMPDGQGQISHIDLNSAQRIEVLRGPFSSLYGNASGGVISVFTAKGQPGTQLQFDALAGAYGTHRDSAQVAGAQGGFDYLISANNFLTDGYRNHSAARRSNANVRFDFALDEKTDLKFIANAVDMPEAQDPLGLKRAQWESNPRQAGDNAETFNTRKSVRQQQIGADYQRRISDNDAIDIMLYGGQRATMQFQSTPVASQNSAASAGGIVDLDRKYYGNDTHWTHDDSVFGQSLQLTAGMNFDNLKEARQGFLNYIGNATGVIGALRRDESNRVYNFDQYLQAQYEISQSLLLDAGLRNSRVQINSNDHYIVPGNGDDSGNKTFHATTPTLGLSWAANDAVRVYADYGKGFETPTLNELAYKSTSGANTGLNFALRPSRSEHYELGTKIIFDDHSRIEFSIFHVITHDEISVAANSNGRSVYQNVGKTLRDGAEWQYAGHWDNGIGLQLALTILRAKYADDFTSCPGAPCSASQAVTVAAGNRLPGVPVNTLFGQLSWTEPKTGFNTALTAHSESKLYVDDANSDATNGFATLDWNAGFTQKIQNWQLSEFLRVDNLTDKKYVGSVIVNESNSRYFESAPERNIYVGLNVKSQF